MRETLSFDGMSVSLIVLDNVILSLSLSLPLCVCVCVLSTFNLSLSLFFILSRLM